MTAAGFMASLCVLFVTEMNGMMYCHHNSKRFGFSGLLYLLLITSVSISIVSCLRGNGRLREAELLVEIDPKAADSILASMSEPVSRGERAWYAVLKSLVDYRNEKSFTSDSLIRTATEYYGSQRKGYRAAVAWYSQGCVYSRMKKDLGAIHAFIKAKDLFPDTLVRYYALTEFELGKRYENRKMFNLAMEQLMCSRINADRLQDSVTSYWANVNLFNCAFKLGQKHLSDSIFYTIVTKNERYVHEYQLDDPLYEGTGTRHFFIGDKKDDFTLSGEAGYAYKASFYFSKENYDSAYCYYMKSMDNNTYLYGRQILANYLTRVSILMNNQDEAIYWHDYYARLCDSISIVEKTDAKDISDLQIIHSQELTEERMQNRHKRFMILGISSLLLLVALTFLTYALFKNREKKRIIRRQKELLNMEQEIRQGSIAILETQVREQSQTNPQARTALLSLYAHRLRTGSDYFRKTTEYKSLLSAASGASLDAEEKTAVMAALEQSFGDSIVDMQTEYPGLDKEESLTLILSSLGFKNELIAELFGNVTAEAIRKRKYRFGKSNPDFFELFR